MKKNEFVKLIILIAVVAFAAWRWYNREQNLTQTEFALDTVIEINATAKGIDLKSILDSTFYLIEKYENDFSFYADGGLISRINSSGSTDFSMNKDLSEIFSYARELYQETDSLYDITIGALTELWDFDKKQIPSKTQIKKAQAVMGLKNIRFNRKELYRPVGYKFNLGSLAKGYIIDKAVDFMKKNRVKSAIINAGGDIRIFGQDKPVRVGIQNPRGERNEIVDVLCLTNLSIVTSGDYERYFIKDGIRYHHILNPETGFPARNAVSATVIADSALEADALSTAIFLLDPARAIQLIEKRDGVEAVIYYLNGKKLEKILSNGMNKYLEVKNVK